MALIVVIDYFGADTVEGNKYTRNSYTHNTHYSGGKEHFFRKEQRNEAHGHDNKSETENIHYADIFYDIRPYDYADKGEAEHYGEHDGSHGAAKLQGIFHIERYSLSNKRKCCGIKRKSQAVYPELAVGDKSEYRLKEIGLFAVFRLCSLFLDVFIASEGSIQYNHQSYRAVYNSRDAVAYLRGDNGSENNRNDHCDELTNLPYGACLCPELIGFEKSREQCAVVCVHE